MPGLLSWLRMGAPSNDTTATETRPQTKEIVDISNDSDGSDTIVVARPPQSSNKRKIIDISHSDAEDVTYTRPHKSAKAAKTAKTARRATIAAPQTPKTIVDISRSDEEDESSTVIKKRGRGRPRKHAERAAGISKANGMRQWLDKNDTAHERLAFRELDATQFQNRLRGPIAWCKRPMYTVPFKSKFAPDGAKVSLSTATSGVRRNSSEASMSKPTKSVDAESKLARGKTMTGTDRSVTGKRPQRTLARQSYTSMTGMEEESEDELAAPSRSKKVKARRSRANDSDDSDYELQDEVDEYDHEMEDASEVSLAELRSDTSTENANDFLMRAAKVKTPQTATKKTVTGGRSKSKATRMKSMLKAGQGLNHDLPPCSDIHEIFADITKKANSLGFVDALTHIQSRPIRVATMCSGTECPLLALQMIEDCLRSSSTTSKIQLHHLFSAEIVPFKQAYIERNFHPNIIFRDITELTNAFDDSEPMATTAYGARVPIPQDLDMVIAGTSCVDFSGQNSRKKGLRDGGESADTWNAVLAFSKAARPGIVLLENVSGAPWDSMLEDYEEIGYECSGVLIDTKDYYLPQTRQRGYMVAFDKQKLAATKTADAAIKWSTLMEKFKRPASSPVSSFLLPSDQVKAPTSRNDDVIREVDWSTCEITQMQYRQETRLGDGRPVTSWTVTGYIQPPDYGHKLWFRGLVERVKDTIDAAVLRKALVSNGMYDLTFKLRIIDLSQNVYRETDSRPFGIIGCITPTGMFYLSNRGRALAAEELLQLQGLPLHKVSFTTETPSNI